MFRRRQKRRQSQHDAQESTIQQNPLDRSTNANPWPKLLLMLCGILLLVDFALTVTRRTWPTPQSGLPLLQRLAYAPGSRGGTYAQNYQDTWIVQLTNATSNFGASSANPLFFLDIGAYHGLWCSNSYLLEKEHGWEGACVEPFPDGFRRRSCQLFVNAMSDTDGAVVHFGGAGQERSIGYAETSNTTFGRFVRNGHLVAETISFPTLLKKSSAPSFIAFISLNVEGHEYVALTKFPWDSYKVGAWIVEGHSTRVKELLERHGYKQRSVQNRGVDEYYVADEFWKEDIMLHKEWRDHPMFSWGC
ncbi:hypothetical protein ACHAW6_012990 [Cyclotella cf. meneghiniana]